MPAMGKNWIVVFALVAAFLLCALFILAQEGASSAAVDPEVIDALQDSETASVIVMLEDGPSTPVQKKARGKSDKPIDGLEQKKQMIEERQKEVLSSLSAASPQGLGIQSVQDVKEKPDVEVESVFSLVNGFSAEVTEEGLEQLRATPGVKLVYPNRE